MIRALLASVVLALSTSCGILNFATDFRSPFILGEGEGEPEPPDACGGACENTSTVCDGDSGTCVKCLESGDCPGLFDFCDENECKAPEQPCFQDGDCFASGLDFCVNDLCVQCRNDADCGDPTPICGADGFCFGDVVVTGCTSINDCTSGQFCSEDGNCQLETVGCPAGGDADAVEGGNPLLLPIEFNEGAVYFVPEGGISATLVVLHDILGDNSRWNGVPLCQLLEAGHVVVNMQNTSADAAAHALEFLFNRYSTAHQNAALVAASSATEVVTQIEAQVNLSEHLPKRFILLSVGDYTGQPADVNSALLAMGSPPTLFMTVAGDNQCGQDCVAAQGEFDVAANSDWEFGVYPGTGHGCDLLTTNLDANDASAPSQQRAQDFLAATFR
jgi:hypothetical protein